MKSANRKASGKGTIYTAIGREHLKEAICSAESLKRNSPHLEITVFTDLPEEARQGCFDSIVGIGKQGTSKSHFRTDKLLGFARSPYLCTLALDTDTYILDDISEMFGLLERFDLAVCHGHNRRLNHYKELEEGISLPEIPYSFPILNSGVVLYKKNRRTDRFFSGLLQLYKKKGCFFDQPTLREMLWKSGLNFYVLPREYNFNSIEDIRRWGKFNFAEAKPKIFHYTRHKGEDIRKLVDSCLKDFERQKRILCFLKKLGLVTKPLS